MHKKRKAKFHLPTGEWRSLVDENQVYETPTGTTTDEIAVPPSSGAILIR